MSAISLNWSAISDTADDSEARTVKLDGKRECCEMAKSSVCHVTYRSDP